MTLYEMTEEFLELLEMAEDPDTDPQALADTMEALNMDLEDKADGYAKVIRQLEADAAACDAESKRLRAKKTAMENGVKRMKQALQTSMELTGKRKFKTALFSFGIQKDPASLVIDEDYIENIPPRYLIYQDPVIDRQKLKADLTAGMELDGIAHLEQTEGVRIR